MKRTFIIAVFFIVFLILYFLQSNFFSWYNLAGIKPNLFIVLSLFIGLYLGKNYGFTMGIAFGLFLDFIIGKKIGLNAIMLGIAGLSGGILNKNFSKNNRITFMSMTIGITILCEGINYLLQMLILNAQLINENVVKIIIIEAIYNAIIVAIVYPLIQKAGEKTEEIFTESKPLMRYY